MNASAVLGAPDFTTWAPVLGQNGISDPISLAFDANGNLWVTDSAYVRVVEFVPPFTNDMNASLVIGQPDFVTSGPGPIIGPDTLSLPCGAAFMP